ncbi:MAG: hypothetical protein LH629_16395 [Ignavibacteria bacterium]|nr:hypothetical protein [Ignavibacteria bacterium]
MKSFKNLSLFIFLSFSISSCDKTETEKKEIISCGCGKQSPLTEISWINTVLSSSYSFPNGSLLRLYSGASFYCCTYNNGNVFYLINPASSLGIATFVVFNCEGAILINGNDQQMQEFLLQKKNEQLLWTK